MPESPQHRRWREARLTANQRIAGFRSDVRGVLDEALDLLETCPNASSATWFALTDQLHGTCWRLASATYYLREWQEPEDSAPNIDDAPYRQSGRRNTQGWGRS